MRAAPPSPAETSDAEQRPYPMFPIQSEGRDYYKKHPQHPTQIPWSVADKAYSVYSARHGRDQSLNRLAERGGFGAGEMDDFLPGWRDEASEIVVLRARCASLEARTRAYEQRCSELAPLIPEVDALRELKGQLYSRCASLEAANAALLEILADFHNAVTGKGMAGAFNAALAERADARYCALSTTGETP